MRSFVGTWDHDSPGNPVWTAYDVDADKNVARMIERFPDGLTERREAAWEGWPSLSDQPFEGTDDHPPLAPTLTLVEVSAAGARGHALLIARRSPLCPARAFRYAPRRGMRGRTGWRASGGGTR